MEAIRTTGSGGGNDTNPAFEADYTDVQKTADTNSQQEGVGRRCKNLDGSHSLRKKWVVDSSFYVTIHHHSNIKSVWLYSNP
jgi:hypothetical protein